MLDKKTVPIKSKHGMEPVCEKDVAEALRTPLEETK